MTDYTTLHTTTKHLLSSAFATLTSRQARNDAAMDAGRLRYGSPLRFPPALSAGLRREYRNIEESTNRLQALNDDFIALAAVADRVKANGGTPHTPMARPIPGRGYAALSLVECQRRVQREVREAMGGM
jgi:hypothetical protein